MKGGEYMKRKALTVIVTLAVMSMLFAGVTRADVPPPPANRPAMHTLPQPAIRKSARPLQTATPQRGIRQRHTRQPATNPSPDAKLPPPRTRRLPAPQQTGDAAR